MGSPRVDAGLRHRLSEIPAMPTIVALTGPSPDTKRNLIAGSSGVFVGVYAGTLQSGLKFVCVCKLRSPLHGSTPREGEKKGKLSEFYGVGLANCPKNRGGRGNKLFSQCVSSLEDPHRGFDRRSPKFFEEALDGRVAFATLEAVGDRFK